LTTLSDLIDETRTLLMSSAYQEANRLNGAVAAGDTSITFHYNVGGMQVIGSIIAIDLEHIRVWEWSGNTATVVERGVEGTTAASHADGTLVEVAPKFSKFVTMRAINQDLDSLSSGANSLFCVKTLDLTFNPAISGYDLAGVTPGSVMAIQELRYKQPGPSHYWPQISSFATSRDMASSEFASTMAIFLYQGAFPGMAIHVRYRAKFTHFANLTDDVTTVAGLPASAADLPPLGAMLRLGYPREVKRNFDEAQSDAKLQEDVPAGSMLKSFGGIQAMRSARVAEEAASLLSQYGFPLRAF